MDKKNNSFAKFTLYYSILFVFMATASYMPWIINKASFVWTIDGLNQHYPALVYIGKYLREIVYGVVLHGKFHADMWDMSIGFGSDVMGTLNFYCFGDPLDILVGLVPTRYMEAAYDAMVVLRMYLAGMALGVFALYKKANHKAAVIGAMVYVFSGYVIMYGIKHPLFINSLIYLPIILVGLDKVLRKQKSVLFSVSVGVALASNFYFFYVLSIAMFVYAVYRVADLYKENLVKEYIQAFFRSLFYYLIGVANACIIFVPVVYSFLGTKRTDSRIFNNLFYSKWYYAGSMLSMVGYGTMDFQTNLGYLSVCIVLFMAFMTLKDKKYNCYRVFFLLCVAGLCLPIVGFGMTGFSYVSNRWVFLFTFVLAMGTVRAIENWDRIEMKHLVFPLVFLLVAVIFNVAITKGNMILNTHMSIWVFTAGFAFVYLAKKFKIQSKKILYILMCVVLVVETGLKSMSLFDWSEQIVASQFVPAGKVFEITDNKAIDKIKELDDSVYRVECMCDDGSNYGLVNDIPTVSSYYSVTQGNVSDTMEQVENADIFTASWIRDLSRRSGLLELAGVKYFVAKETGSDCKSVPYNFTKIDEIVKFNEADVDEESGEMIEPEVTSIYKNNNPLPIVYGYKDYMSREDWEELSGIDKEEAMLQVAVVEDGTKLSDIDVSKSNPVYDSKTVYTKEQVIDRIIDANLENVEVVGDKIVVKWGSAYVYMSYDGVPNAETYLVMDGIDYEQLSEKWQRKIIKEAEAIAEEDGRIINVNKGTDTFWLGANVDTKYAGFKFCSKYYIYKGATSAACNLGYSYEPRWINMIYLSAPGVYDFEDVTIVANPMNSYKSQIKKLKVKVKNLKVEDDTVSCKVKLKEDRIMCVAVPYSKGWEATVDGEKVETFQVNGMYTGFKMKAGKHKIVMQYTSPGFACGSAISAMGIIATVCIALANRKRKEKKTVEKTVEESGDE